MWYNKVHENIRAHHKNHPNLFEIEQEQKEEFGPGSGEQTESELVAKDDNQNDTSKTDEKRRDEHKTDQKEKEEETEPHNLDKLDEVTEAFHTQSALCR